MASTYVNDLRLEEIGSGEQSGTWGDTTNTNLELIAEAFSFGTEAITTNADTHTTTIADGATDPGRSMFLKYTGTLDSACTITIGPNTVSKLWFIENGTSGSQNIIISQGSGANITIPPGDTKAIYSDGAGSGAAMVDAFASLSVVDLKVQDDLTVTDDMTVGGTLGVTGVVTANAGVVVDNFTLDGTTLALSSGDFTLDVAGDINLDADGGDINLKDGGTAYAHLSNSSLDLFITNPTSDKDIYFRGNDGGSFISALTLDMSDAGTAIFNSHIKLSDDKQVFWGDGTVSIQGDAANEELSIGVNNVSALAFSSSEAVFNDGSGDINFRVESNSLAHAFYVDGGSNSGIGHITMGNYGAADSGYFVTMSDAANKVALIAAETTGTAVEIRSTASGSSSSGPDLYLNRFATGSDDNITSSIFFGGGNDAGEQEIFSRITTQIKDASNGAESGAFFIETMKAGTNRNRLQIRDDATVFNEDSVDVDFRIESNDNTHALFVDGGNSHVCLNTATDHGAVLNIETTGNAVNLTLACTDTDTGEGPIMDFTRDAGNVPGDGDLMGVIRFRNDNTNLEMINYATISSTVTDVSDGTEDGKLTFKAMHDGTLTEFLSLEGTSNGIVFNNDRALLDFRVASGAINNMLYVDASDNSVCIGNNTTSHRFIVHSEVSGDHVAAIRNDGNNTNKLGLVILAGTDDNSGTNTMIQFRDGDNTDVGAITASGGTVTYAAFTAVHPAILPDSDNANGYAYGTLVETTSVSYEKNSSGNDFERGIIYNVTKSTSANSKSVLGAYSGKLTDWIPSSNKHNINVLGDGHILCNNSGGNIAVGDGICTSATAGIGQKATASPSMIIGIAQEAVTFSGTETKLVPVQYGLQQFTPWS